MLGITTHLILKVVSDDENIPVSSVLCITKVEIFYLSRDF